MHYQSWTDVGWFDQQNCCVIRIMGNGSSSQATDVSNIHLAHDFRGKMGIKGHRQLVLD